VSRAGCASISVASHGGGGCEREACFNNPLLLWVVVILLILGQIGLATGLLKLGRKYSVSKFSICAYMFLLNIILSLALSPVAVIVGLIGWVLTFLAANSALKKRSLVEKHTLT